MKKLIVIPDDIITVLRVKAAKAGKSFSKFIEDLLIKESKLK